VIAGTAKTIFGGAVGWNAIPPPSGPAQGLRELAQQFVTLDNFMDPATVR
jgi:hypothetical protein